MIIDTEKIRYKVNVDNNETRSCCTFEELNKVLSDAGLRKLTINDMDNLFRNGRITFDVPYNPYKFCEIRIVEE